MMYQAWKRPGRKPSTAHAVSLPPGVIYRRLVGHTAKRNVDQTVCRADSSLDPDSQRREEDGDEAEEDVAAAHHVC